VPVGNLEILNETAELCGYSFPFKKIRALEEARSGKNDEILDIKLESPVEKGKVSGGGGKHTYEILKTCTDLCLSGKSQGVVTAPINKESLKLAGYNDPGHTEIFKDLSGASSVDAIFCIENLKIFFLSRHLSLRDAISMVKENTILETLIRIDRVMKDLGYSSPRLGVPGLNPHCGDGGLFGREEIDEIEPAIRKAKSRGIKVEGPVGADSIYHLGIFGHFDAILSLYHDQGHIASKTYNFYKTVTLTAGLPFLRTSVDHGTAFDIAWKGVANPESLIRAIELALKLLRKKNDS